MNSPYLRIENFLPTQDRDEIFDFAIAQQQHYVRSSVSTDVPDYRHSHVLYAVAPVEQQMIWRLQSLMPIITSALNVSLPVDRIGIECQVTASEDGSFFKRHPDRGEGATSSRCISYVYYLHKIPRPFAGGQLILYNNWSFTTIEPQDNTIIFFRSECWHEVLTVRCPSEEFANHRFTVNGWINQP